MYQTNAPIAHLIAQLLTTDYGGKELKRQCLLHLLQNSDMAQQALTFLERGPLPVCFDDLKSPPGPPPEPFRLSGDGPTASEQVLTDRTEDSFHANQSTDPKWDSLNDGALKKLYHAVHQFPEAWGLTEAETAVLFAQHNAISHILGIWMALWALFPSRSAIEWI